MTKGPARFVILVFAILLAGCAPSRPASGISSEDVDLAIKVNQTRQDNRSQAEACVARYPSAKAFQFTEYFWESHNYKVLHGADIVLDSLPSDRRSELEIGAASQKPFSIDQLDRSESKRLSDCQVILKRLTQESDYQEAFDRSVKDRMEAIYAASNPPRNAWRDSEYVAGCMKSNWNSGARDFDRTKGMCECTMRAMTSNTTDEQQAAFVANPHSAENIAFLRTAREQNLICRRQWGAGG